MRRKWDKAKLSQSACLLEGLCIFLHRTDGNFAVIIHSYRDCANVFPRGMSGMYMTTPGRFFCTNLREADVMGGATLDRLEQCIRLVAEERRPEIIYVFGSCLSELIGDDIEGTVRALSRELPVPVIGVTSSGLDDITQKKIIDWHAELMYRACRPAAAAMPRSVNIIGFPPDRGHEITALLEQAGITVNVWLDGTAPLHEWQKLPAGALNVVPEKNLFPALLDHMERDLGTPVIEAPVPVGLHAAETFFTALAARLDLSDAMAPLVAERKQDALARVQPHLERFRGAHLGYNIGTDRNYHPHRVARDGMGEAGFFEELGFEVTLLIQGSPDPERKRLITEQLVRLGIRADFDIFMDNVAMTPALMKKHYDLVYCVDFMADMVRPTQTPMISIGTLLMGFDGFVHNVRMAHAAMEQDRRRTGGAP